MALCARRLCLLSCGPKRVSGGVSSWPGLGRERTTPRLLSPPPFPPHLFFSPPGLFRLVGLGTAADHHVHHRTFVYNYGHTMMWWDWIAGTYKRPEDVKNFDFSGAKKVRGGSSYELTAEEEARWGYLIAQGERRVASKAE